MHNAAIKHTQPSHIICHIGIIVLLFYFISEVLILFEYQITTIICTGLLFRFSVAFRTIIKEAVHTFSKYWYISLTELLHILSDTVLILLEIYFCLSKFICCTS